MCPCSTAPFARVSYEPGVVLISCGHDGAATPLLQSSASCAPMLPFADRRLSIQFAQLQAARTWCSTHDCAVWWLGTCRRHVHVLWTRVRAPGKDKGTGVAYICHPFSPFCLPILAAGFVFPKRKEKQEERCNSSPLTTFSGARPRERKAQDMQLQSF